MKPEDAALVAMALIAMAAIMVAGRAIVQAMVLEIELEAKDREALFLRRAILSFSETMPIGGTSEAG